MLFDAQYTDENLTLVLDKLTSMIGSVHRSKIKVVWVEDNTQYIVKFSWVYTVRDIPYRESFVLILEIDGGKVKIPGSAIRRLKRNFYRTLKGVK